MQKTDDMLVTETKDGSLEAFDLLMQKYEAEVYRVAYSYTRDTDSAMDISQNVFIKVFENLNSFRRSSTFKTWLIRIAWNESRNWIKRNKRHLMHQDVEATQISTVHKPDAEMESTEDKIMLLRSLYNLNTRYRLAVVLRYFENYSLRDIAAILDCSEGVVKNMLFRSLQKMKQTLKKSEIGEIQ